MFREMARELIVGAYDLHTHTTPSAFPRALNDLELIREADALGMAGVMIKAHYGSTSTRAALVNLISGSQMPRPTAAWYSTGPPGALIPTRWKTR